MTIDDILFPKQKQFYQDYKTYKYDVMMYGGGMGGGKSWLMAVLFLSLAYKYGGTSYAIFRKNLTTLRKTTYQTFKRVAEHLHITYEEKGGGTHWLVPGIGGVSTIWFSEIDQSKDPDFNKVKSFEVTSIGIDEANEIAEKAFNILTVRKGRVNPYNQHCFVYLSCNPDKNWVKTRLYDKWRDGVMPENYYFLPSLATDNIHLSKEYIKSLEELPEADKERYLYGNWDFSDDPNQLIPYEWIKRNLNEEGTRPPEYIGMDVAREGDDRTVIALGTKSRCSKIEVYEKLSTIEGGQTLVNRIKELQIPGEQVAIDVVGVGGGVVDYARSQGYRVKAFNSGEAPTGTAGALIFKNRRAEAFWRLREAFEKDEYTIPSDQELIRELTNIRYTTTDKVIQIEAKADQKKRLGASPDLADAVAMLKWSSNQAGTLTMGNINIR